MTTFTTAEIVRMYQQPNMSIEKVARIIGVSPPKTRNILVEAGVILRQCGNQPEMERAVKPCKGMTWYGLNDKADIPAELFEIRTTYRR